MEAFNLNDMTQIMTIYLIFNFIIAICIIYIILSILFRYVLKRKNSVDEIYSKRKNKDKNIRKRKKDIIEFFWEEEPNNKIGTFFKRGFLIVIIVLTIIYIFNSINFIMDNIDIVKDVL